MVVVVGQARIQRDRHGGLPGTLDRVPELVQRIAQQAVDVRWRRGPLEEVPVDALGRPDLAATVQQRAGQQQLVRIPVVRRRGIAEAVARLEAVGVGGAAALGQALDDVDVDTAERVDEVGEALHVDEDVVRDRDAEDPLGGILGRLYRPEVVLPLARRRGFRALRGARSPLTRRCS